MLAQAVCGGGSSKKALSQGLSLRRETQKPLGLFASLIPLGSPAWAGVPVSFGSSGVPPA